MAKVKANTSDEIRTSVSTIYSELLSKRREEKEAKEERKRKEEELKEQEKEAKKKNENDVKLSKKERREAEFDNWKQVIIGLTGEDLEYANTKKSKKKYRKWIDDEVDKPIISDKPKKVKKKNYSKEFAPELQMLKTIVADQNKFTADLQKRFNAMAGPATKDAMPPNKTMVDLASVINAGRSNSLGVLKEIGNLKKVIAELYIKQKKEEASGNGSSSDSMDLALMGSNLASALFSDDIRMPVNNTPQYSPQYQQPVSETSSPITVNAVAYPGDSSDNSVIRQQSVSISPQIQEFDPNSWNGPDNLTINKSVLYETIPHSIVVEKNQSTNEIRFKAISTATGEELPECPIPTYDPRNLNLNEKDLIAKGQFDETYKLEII